MTVCVSSFNPPARRRRRQTTSTHDSLSSTLASPYAYHIAHIRANENMSIFNPEEPGCLDEKKSNANRAGRPADGRLRRRASARQRNGSDPRKS